jgi:enoyl-[acyl-carrier protein] reductase II
MRPEVLEEHIIKTREATENPFGVNIPLLYPSADQHIQTILKHNVPIVFTSAGSPKKWTAILQKEGIKVIHVVSSSIFALKSQDAGVDAVVAEGFEAGGHNGREETTTLCLVPEVVKSVAIPVIAAGGIGSGQAILAAQALGAEGVQIGSLFAASKESSANEAYKDAVVSAKEGDTILTLKELAPVRLIKNSFSEKVEQAYQKGADAESLKMLLGKGRARKAIFEGDLSNGEIEIGQISSSIEGVLSVKEIFSKLKLQHAASLKVDFGIL